MIPLFQVDAFTNRLFHGNPAAIVVLEEWLSPEKMQAISAENNLAETAFLLKGPQGWQVRYFTPRAEINLCGHATLAAAHVLFTEYDVAGARLELVTHLAGTVAVEKQQDWYVLDFPSWPPKSETPPAILRDGLGLGPAEIAFCGRQRDWLIVLKDEAAVANLNPDFNLLKQFPDFVCVSAKADAGRDAAIVSRFFTPADGIDEDPVTGSAHCMLIPYWAKRLGKNQFTAHQISARGGVLRCELAGDRVKIGGQAVTYLKGQISV